MNKRNLRVEIQYQSTLAPKKKKKKNEMFPQKKVEDNSDERMISRN